MNELVKHIEILLLSKDCVIVPNFGGFVAHHIDAHYEEGDCLFYPPLRTIGFNPQLKLNDSLLVQSYVDAYELSYPDALNRIENEVNEIRQKLENEGFFEMEGLGSFTMNNDGIPEFEPCLAGILTPSLYGLSSYEISCLQQNMVDVETENVTTLAMEKPIEEPHAMVVNMNWIRNAAIACAVVFAFFMIPQLKVDNNN
ncbi:MAG: SPOR domain-containing protein, partial [Prevotella sp.]|nr:SPOR domain-containing protein [Prevotella sp.]